MASTEAKTILSLAGRKCAATRSRHTAARRMAVGRGQLEGPGAGGGIGQRGNVPETGRSVFGNAQGGNGERREAVPNSS